MSLLKVRNVTVRFGGNVALDDVGLDAAPGEITGLIGPNGAGKTTLFNVITGLYTPDSGDFLLEGKPYEPTAVHKVAEAGIARTFQNIRLFGDMTAMENVMVGRHVRTRSGVIGAVLKLKSERREEAAIRHPGALRPAHPALGRDRDPTPIAAPAVQRHGNQALIVPDLAVAQAVRIRRVEQRRAGVEGGTDDREGAVLIALG